MKVYCWVAFGMGGAALDPRDGEWRLVERLKSIGVETMDSPYQWSDLQKIHDAAMRVPYNALLCGGGDSLGANEATRLATMLRRTIKFLFGFQRSWFGDQVDVPDNVDHATSIYNPGVIGTLRTLGMGSDPWRLAPGNFHTHLENIPIYANHPDDFGLAQQIVFNRLKQLSLGG